MDLKQSSGLIHIRTEPNLSPIVQKEIDNKYINKNYYSYINKIIPQNSILNRVKYKPDISISDYVKTLNNSRKNININLEQSLKVINLSNKENFKIQKKYEDDNTSNTFLNEFIENETYNQISTNGDNFDRNFGDKQYLYNESPIKNLEYIQENNQNLIDRNNNIKENNNINFITENINIFNNKLDNDKELKYHYLKTENIKNKISIYNNYNDLKMDENYQTNKINQYNNNNNYNYIKSKISLKHNNNNLESNLNDNYFYNNKNIIKNSSSNTTLKYGGFTKNLENVNNIFINRNKSMKYFNQGNIKSQTLENIKNPKFYSNYDNILGLQKSKLNIKLKEYRKKLFREFYKHLLQFYKIRMNNYFYIFIQGIFNKNIPNKNINNINNDFKSYELIFDNKNNNENISKESLHENLNNYYITTDINQRNSYIKNEKSNENTNIKTNSLISNIISMGNPKNNYSIKSVPRLKKRNINNILISNSNFNDRKEMENNSISPSFHFGNKTIIIKNMNFKNYKNIKENELYRDSKELNKKYYQIQTRKIRSKLKDKKNKKENNNKDNNDNIINININEEKKEIKSSIDSQFNEIKNYIKSIKKDKIKIKKNTYQNNLENKKKGFIKLNTLESCDSKDDIDNKEVFNSYQTGNNTYNYLNNNKMNNNSYKNSFNNIISNITNSNEQVSNSINSLGSLNQNKSGFINKANIYKIKTYKNNKNNNFDYGKKTPISEKNIYYSNYNSKKIIKKNKTISNVNRNRNKIFSIIIKNIVTKDKRIYININYYFLFRKTKPLIKRYDLLSPCNNFSINLVGDKKNDKK